MIVECNVYVNEARQSKWILLPKVRSSIKLAVSWRISGQLLMFACEISSDDNASSSICDLRFVIAPLYGSCIEVVGNDN